MRLTAFAVLAALVSMPAMADSTKHNDAHSHAKHKKSTEHSTDQMIHTPATINAVADGSLNVSHPPIPALKWPAMTMDLPLLEGAKVGTVTAGDKVTLMLQKSPAGEYGISAVMPAK